MTIESLQSNYHHSETVHGPTCQVMHGGILSEPFLVKTTGVRQGCLHSPLLFLLVIDWVSKTAYSSPTGMQWTLTLRQEDLEFADDICTLSLRVQDSQHQATNLETTNKRTGLYINARRREQ